MRRAKFEPWHVYRERNYCNQPACFTKGREATLRIIYDKETELYATRMYMGFLVFKLFMFRWGIMPLDAFERYGKESQEDFWYLKAEVEGGRVAKVIATIAVLDSTGAQVGIEEVEMPMMIHQALTKDIAEAIVREAMSATQNQLGEIAAKIGGDDD